MCEAARRRPVPSGIELAETVSEILHAHRTGTATPADTVARSFARIRAHGDPAVFISLRDEAAAIAEAKALMATGAEGRPLYGIPVAIKDNIDAEGLPTTAACPAFSYKPGKDSTAVAKLRRAGAIVIGKTNLDQFATGLVGVRSPYGIPRNTFDPAMIPGGSSSGSAVAVAAGLVPLSLGTDTAGSGRVPAGLEQHRRSQAEPRACFHGGRRSGLPFARLRVDLRVDHRRLLDRARSDRRDRCGRSLLPRASARTARLISKGRTARRADRRSAAVLRRSHRRGSLRWGDGSRGRTRRADCRNRHRAVL